METTADDHRKNVQICIKKGYIKTQDDFVAYLLQQGINPYDETCMCESFTIIKNYLTSAELSLILLKVTPAFTENLLKINLTANDLTAIPVEFNRLKSLQCLVLNNNKIEVLENFDSMTSLARLELRGNRIKIIENMNSLQMLNHLSLSCNLISSITESSIQVVLPCLTELGLFGNYLGDATDMELNKQRLNDILHTFSNKLPSLSRLYIGGNYFSKITDLNEQIKATLPGLKQLDGHLLF